MISFYTVMLVVTLAFVVVASPWFLLCTAYCALGVIKEMTW